MSLETERRVMLSEWRVVMVSQTSYPITYKLDRPSSTLPTHYAAVRIPLGNRIITKWQEQVRPIENENNESESNQDQWYVVREWTEADIVADQARRIREFNKVADRRDQETTATSTGNHTEIHRVLSEVGLNPSDYIFTPPLENNITQTSTSNHPSAFQTYPSQQRTNHQQSLQSQSHSIFTSARPISYVENPPAPPPPPPPPLNNINNNPQQNSPPIASQPSSTLPAFLLNQSASNTQNTTSPPIDNMSHSYLRRTPPPPPCNSYPHDSSISAEHYLRQINSCENPPIKVVKPSSQKVCYKKEIRIRYLQPPTPPPPAPIIIREKHIPPKPPQSPLLIRERKPEARTPPPLTIRERPPSPPARLEPHVIEKCLPPPPPQPRQIIIERLPTPPPKPRTVIFEKWLPYKKVKRPVLLQKAPTPEPIKPVRNVLIEYEPLKAYTVRRVIEEGVFRVDPCEYLRNNAQSNCGDVRLVERIEDLPPPSEQLRRVLNDYSNCSHESSSHASRYDHHSCRDISEHVPSSIQHLLRDARPASNVDQLTNVSRSSSTPAHRPDRVLSTGSVSPITSPTSGLHQSSQFKTSRRPLQEYRSPNNSPNRPHEDDIY
ncbi:hypothetical protein I4U23_007544 [Adineta vaga]|nr:hypothetical protein I4U23_007544 [Adineta vaga]